MPMELTVAGVSSGELESIAANPISDEGSNLQGLAELAGRLGAVLRLSRG